MSKEENLLGLDPSNEKAMNLLGVTEEVLRDAHNENLDREEQRIVRQRRNSGANKRNVQKALDVLGLDPSKDKAMTTLGMDETDFVESERDKVEHYENECTRKRSNSWLNKKEAAKALKVLGLEPSKEKIRTTLGLHDEQIQEVRGIRGFSERD